MNGIRSGNVFNGTYGEVWFDGEYMAEAIACKGEVNIKYEAVPRVRKLIDGQKMVSMEGKGEIKLKKVSSFVLKKASEQLKAGKSPSYTIISNIDDPDAVGAERVAFYDCKIEKLPLADWERGKGGEETYSFTFEEWELLDTTN